MADSVVGRLIYKITGDVGDITQSLQRTQKQVQGFTNFIRSASGLFGAVAAFRIFTGVGRDLIQQYSAQEQAESLLRASLRDTGENVDNLVLRFKTFASGVQAATTVGDEQVLALVRQARSLGITTDRMEEAARGAIGLSKAFGIDMDLALRGIANAYEGNFTALSRYIPALRTAGSEAEKMATLQKAMAEGFHLARAEAKTGAGQMLQLQNAMSDLKEVGGKALLDFMKPSITALKDFVAGVTASLESTKAYKDYVKGVTEGSEAAAKAQKFAEEQVKKYRNELQLLNLALREEAAMIAGTMDLRGREPLSVLNSLETHRLMRDEVVKKIAAWEKETGVIKKNTEELRANEEAERKRIAAAKARADIMARQAVMAVALAGNIASLENRYTLVAETIDPIAAGIQAMSDRWTMMGVVLGTLAEENANAIERQRQQLEQYQAAAVDMLTAVSPTLEAFGAMLVDVDEGWKAFKAAALDAIAAVIEGYAKQWALMAAAAFVPGPTFNPLAGAGYTALAIAAMIAAGVVKALGEGALVTQPTLALIGEKGPEVVAPLDQIQKFPDRLTVRIGSRDFNAYLEDEFDAGRLRVHPRALKR